MRNIILALAALTLPAAALAQAQAPEAVTITPDPKAPMGKLSDAAVPSAYRLDLTILPDQPNFSGHAEIDATLKAETRSLYLHGRDLKVTRAVAVAGGKTVPLTWTQVDPLGVARIDFAAPLAAGKVTLKFDYEGPFGDGPAGLYRIKVGDDWYAWTQFESIDARAAFPSFDEPGFKTPFAVTLTTRAGQVAVSNSRETGAANVAGGLVRHSFESTKPLPTYLVAFVVGPFAVAEGVAPPTPQRNYPLPIRIIGTKPNAGKLAYALEATPRIVELLEKYFNQPFPFPKLDQIGSPVMPGAMENAGADIYGDNILLLDKGASTVQQQTFGMVVAHELSHQWFGDYVTPAWWDDIWLNESFANWMGYRIGNEWRPDLNIGVGAIAEGLNAMNTDALAAGRPIHQPITRNGEIDSAFDGVTYGKGGQVVAMIAAYLGDEKFRDGVHIHMQRHPYGNATSEEFFAALADGAKDPRVLASLKSFVDQQGVPLVDLSRQGNQWIATQSRYYRLGSNVTPQTWTIPVCVRHGETRTCTLVDQKSQPVAAPGEGAIMPNAGGTGYYRFNLPSAEWDRLIATGASLPNGEGLATIDSLWAQFRMGKGSSAQLLEAARVMSTNPDSNVAVDSVGWLAGWRTSGIVGEGGLADYRRVLDVIYKPRLDALGFSPKAEAYASEDPDKQKLRQSLVGVVAEEAHDAAVRKTLLDAATAYLAGDKSQLDQSYLGVALGVYAQEKGAAGAKMLLEEMLKRDDELFREAVGGSIASTGNMETARWLLNDVFRDDRVRAIEKLYLVGGVIGTAETRDFGYDWLIAHYDEVVKGAGIFAAGQVASLPRTYCSAEKAVEIERTLRPKVEAAGRGELSFDRMIESIRDCGALKQAKQAEVLAALKAFR